MITRSNTSNHSDPIVPCVFPYRQGAPLSKLNSLPVSEQKIGDDTVDPTKMKEETVKEIIREAEAYLGAQLTAGIAIDQKATTLAGSLATIVVAIIGIAIVSLTNAEPNYILVWASGSCSLIFFVSLILAVAAARPISFEYVGNTPSAWSSTDDMYGPLHISLMAQANHYSKAISKNNADLAKNAKLMKWAAVLMAAAPFVGFIFALGAWALGA